MTKVLILSTSMLALVALTAPAFAAYGSDQSSSPFFQADLHPGAGMLANNNFGGPKDESGNDRRGPRDGGDVPGQGKPTSSGQDGG